MLQIFCKFTCRQELSVLSSIVVGLGLRPDRIQCGRSGGSALPPSTVRAAEAPMLGNLQNFLCTIDCGMTAPRRFKGFKGSGFSCSMLGPISAKYRPPAAENPGNHHGVTETQRRVARTSATYPRPSGSGDQVAASLVWCPRCSIAQNHSVVLAL